MLIHSFYGNIWVMKRAYTYTQLANFKGRYSKGFWTLKPKQIKESPHNEFQLPTKSN